GEPVSSGNVDALSGQASLARAGRASHDHGSRLGIQDELAKAPNFLFAAHKRPVPHRASFALGTGVGEPARPPHPFRALVDRHAGWTPGTAPRVQHRVSKWIGRARGKFKARANGPEILRHSCAEAVATAVAAWCSRVENCARVRCST